MRRLLWRIRTKLLVSSLFIAVVPVVLLTIFFLLAGVLFTGLVASHLLSTEVDRQARDLDQTARIDASRTRRSARRLSAERLKAAEARHPGLSWVASSKAAAW